MGKLDRLALVVPGQVAVITTKDRPEPQTVVRAEGGRWIGPRGYIHDHWVETFEEAVVVLPSDDQAVGHLVTMMVNTDGKLRPLDEIQQDMTDTWWNAHLYRAY